MNSSIENRVALVTGAGSGIGLETARELARAGAAVMLADLDEQAVQGAAADLRKAGFRASAVRCDVTDEAEVAAMVERTVSEYGQLDFAFNNAGIHAPVAETADAEGADFDRVIAVNLRGIWNCMKHELRHMRQRGSGAIVNCSSQSGLNGIPGLGAYTASKHAVLGLTKSAALEYAAKGIRVNAICPGSTDTPMVAAAFAKSPEGMQAVVDDIPAGHLGRPEHIASAVLWLCSPGAGFTIGHALVVDGGYSAR